MLFFLNNAFGAEQFTQAVGHERVVLGFPGIGGRREGSTTKFYVLPQQPTTLGEVNGQITSRLRLLAALITATGHPVTITTQIDAWLKTHAVFVTCMAAAIDQCGSDSVRLAHTRTAVALVVLPLHWNHFMLVAVKSGESASQFQRCVGATLTR